jgi:hypothetical protein
MKGIIFTALLALSSVVFANGIVATFVNGADGETMLTDAPCHNNSAGRIVIATEKGGVISLIGCALTLPPDRILVSWDVGGASIFKSSDFTLIGTPTRGWPATGGLPSAPTGGHFAKFKDR